MGLDRGRLAKIDRRVFAELDHSAGVQTVKVPVSGAVWSTWRRYCDAMGLSMGQGVASLIVDELGTVVGVEGDHGAVFDEQIAHQADLRAAQLDAREEELAAQADALRRKEEHLRVWERGVNTQRVATTRLRTSIKVGRNERCPCGSGLKYKHCHGLPGGAD